jgi:hypothetical protein
VAAETCPDDRFAGAAVEPLDAPAFVASPTRRGDVADDAIDAGTVSPLEFFDPDNIRAARGPVPVG